MHYPLEFRFTLKRLFMVTVSEIGPVNNIDWKTTSFLVIVNQANKTPHTAAAWSYRKRPE